MRMWTNTLAHDHFHRAMNRARLLDRLEDAPLEVPPAGFDRLLKKIDDTLNKIDAGEYGYCNSCGVEIGFHAAAWQSPRDPGLCGPASRPGSPCGIH